MSFASQTTQQKFPFSYDKVFNHLLEVLPKADMQLKSQDKLIGRINASGGMSIFSWGENITFIIEKISDELTSVSIESSLKLGSNLTGAHRHQKNFDTIIMLLSQHLQGKLDMQSSIYQINDASENNEALQHTIFGVVLVTVCAILYVFAKLQ